MAKPTESPPEAPEVSLAQVGDVVLAYEEFGDPADETMLMVMGLGMQMLGWDEGLCEMLAGRGFHVVRFDNRDSGLSSKIGGSRRPNLIAGIAGLTGSASYTLDEMAADTVGLLDALGVDRAHLVGASMGGMIAQIIAARRPQRAASLCSIMAGSGRRRLSTVPKLATLPVLLKAPAEDREGFIEDMVRTFDRIGSPAYPRDEERLRRRAALSYDRCFYPKGTARQLMAVLAEGDRSDELGRISVPTVVIHGSEDPLTPPAAGREVAGLIGGARLEVIEGMGHDLPEPLWPRLVDLIAGNAQRARRADAPAV